MKLMDFADKVFIAVDGQTFALYLITLRILKPTVFKIIAV